MSIRIMFSSVSNRAAASVSDDPGAAAVVRHGPDQPAGTVLDHAAEGGLDLRDITSVSFTDAVGADGVGSGGVYLQDLTFDTRAEGVSSVHSRPTVDVASTKVQEPAGTATDELAVYLDKASLTPVTTYLTLIGSATGTVGLAMDPVTFQPGQTCQVVSAR